MALIEVGSLNNFAVIAKPAARQTRSFLEKVKTFGDLSQVSRGIEEDTFELFSSAEPRGVAIKRLHLSAGFEGFLQGVFKPTNEIYFVAWAWDLGGQKIFHYPGPNVEAKEVLIPMKVGRVKDFIGQGINLFPRQTVKGGIAIRIQVWESDEDVRNFGKAMTNTADAIQRSELNKLLSLVSVATGVTGATVTLIKDAAVELSKVIGTILQSNGDDYVDFFEGYYASDQPWTSGEDSYQGNASSLTLNKY